MYNCILLLVSVLIFEDFIYKKNKVSSIEMSSVKEYYS